MLSGVVISGGMGVVIFIFGTSCWVVSDVGAGLLQPKAVRARTAICTPPSAILVLIMTFCGPLFVLSILFAGRCAEVDSGWP
jgi:hypothetical protein